MSYELVRILGVAEEFWLGYAHPQDASRLRWSVKRLRAQARDRA